MFEVILFAIIIYYIYRSYSKRKSPNVKKKRPRPVYYYGSPQRPPPPQDIPQNRVIEEMKRCPACGTFNPKSYTLYYEGEYFCSMECRNQKN